LQLTIEKLIYGGDGLGRLPADAKGPGKAVFVPFVLAGENVEAEPVEQRPGFVRAKLNTVISPSPLRIEPGCPYFGQCGGCQYQHASYDEQLRVKAGILVETVQRIAKIDLASALGNSGSQASAAVQIHPSPPWQYRNRTRMRIRGGASFAIGYNRFGSHEMLAVEQCPISSPLLNRALSALWQEGHAGHVPESLREAQFFANHGDSSLMIEFSVDDRGSFQDKQPSAEKLEKLAGLLRARLPELVGVIVFPAGASEDDVPTPMSAPHVSEPLAIFGSDQTIYRTGTEPLYVSAGSFFQTNRFLIDDLTKLVAGNAHGRLALDLYAGVGLFSVALARNFARVIAVESSPFSSRDLRLNAGRNIKPVHARTESFLEKSKGLEPEFIVVDPPRAGMGERVSQAVAALKAPRITYVSCDPATFARDLRVLAGAGYRVRNVQLIDLFPQTFHIESVWELEA
jgi:23S rRNA (uracil1939-C5)-methyltransferase